MERLTDGLIGVFTNGHDYATEGNDWWYRGIKEVIKYTIPSDHQFIYKAPISPYIKIDTNLHKKIRGKGYITMSVSFVANFYSTEFKAPLFD